MECDFTTFPDKILTKVHHNSEESIYVHGFEPPASYIRDVKYFATKEQIEAVRSQGAYCQQYLKVECFAAEAFLEAYWLDVNGSKMSYTDHEDRPGCKCFLDKACDEGRSEYVKFHCSQVHMSNK